MKIFILLVIIHSLPNTQGGVTFPRFDPGTYRKPSNTAPAWPGGYVDYKVDRDFRDDEKELIHNALSVLSKLFPEGCLKFLKLSEGLSSNFTHLKFVLGSECKSHLGRGNGTNIVELAYHCLNQGSILREIVHALGLPHEHTRLDRDLFIDVNSTNILQSNNTNYHEFYEKTNHYTYQTPFDMMSIGLFNRWWHTIDEQIPIITAPMNPSFNKEMLSATDIVELSRVYKCEISQEKWVNYGNYLKNLYFHLINKFKMCINQITDQDLAIGKAGVCGEKFTDYLDDMIKEITTLNPNWYNASLAVKGECYRHLHKHALSLTIQCFDDLERTDEMCEDMLKSAEKLTEDAKKLNRGPGVLEQIGLELQHTLERKTIRIQRREIQQLRNETQQQRNQIQILKEEAKEQQQKAATETQQLREQIQKHVEDKTAVIGLLKDKYDLLSAAKGGDEIGVKILLKLGTSVDETDGSGNTALHWAAQYGHVRIVEMLLDSGVSVDQSTKYGGTALMLAAMQDHVEVVRVLLQHGVNVNQRDNDGWTALMLAAEWGHVEVVRVLLQHGANVNQQNNHGETALMRAEKNGQTQVANLIRNF